MRSLTQQEIQELQDLIDGGNDFTRAIDAQCLAAEQTIKEISELIAYYRDIDAENPDETIRMIAVADELQTILNRSKS